MTTNNYFRGEAVKKVWLNRYPADVPAEINPDRYQSLVELFEHATTRYADQPAFINMGEVMTGGAVWDPACRNDCRQR